MLFVYSSDKETTTTNDESEDDEVKPPTAIPTRINSMANLMNFLPSIKRNMSLVKQDIYGKKLISWNSLDFTNKSQDKI
jgi:hypothetical protein